MEKRMPDYRRIYSDLVSENYPDKKEEYKSFLDKKDFSILDVITFNKILFREENKNTFIFNQKHRSYNESSIMKILDYQKKNKLNNTQLAAHFKLSRNSVTKWNRLFKKQQTQIAPF
ncbi:helix-turn-helix domain-containing protein [Chryseobacterium soli]|uniref:helix-turn-helix domain-containing protein n=1 Tax=Chryseobacterium soli TaxID=445961 RepID=UPI0029543608|nr:helix-turn-helix domain-containing protein [Chryseobacterium soli]MDV7699278.1 helix-turn-helix domain-containing protein [Chryseobacterium soli]